MQVKVLSETVKDLVDGRLVIASQGDQITVPDEKGREWCANGWAEDVAGQVTTGDRVPGARARITPALITQATS